VGSKTFDGIRFSAFVDDHPPPHFHAYYAGSVMIVELSGGKVRLARRKDRVKPRNTKRSDIRHVLETARKHADELMNLWRVARG
jgi:hypothetical protein